MRFNKGKHLSFISPIDDIPGPVGKAGVTEVVPERQLLGHLHRVDELSASGKPIPCC